MGTYYQEHREEYLRKVMEYQRTKIGRATRVLNDCRRSDRKHGRSEGDLTAEWIADNILSKPCAHCGETDWHKLGCNRLDNSKPHTKDNVESCCWECNNKLGHDSKRKVIHQFSIDGEFIKEWEYAEQAANAIGCSKGSIADCCRGKLKTCYGFIWKYPL